ncbi:MAG: hypothetical protein WC169_01275 [Dehalococcoidia bacterium]|jgi:regulatory protein YycI of two-component signal transduction system YycFG
MKQQIVITSEKGRGLKLISWILAYAVWIFIFLIPIIGIVIILIYLSKNRAQQRGAVITDRTQAQYKKLNSVR